MIAYESQRVARWYLELSLILFCLQVAMGLWVAANYAFTLPQGLVDVFSFATARAIHTNTLVAWLLLGFMGGSYFILPLECKRELFSVAIAYLQLVIFAGTAITAVVGFLFGWTQGKPLLEIPVPLDMLIVVAALLFVFNVAMTIFKAKERSLIQWMLLAGVTFLSVLYLFGIPFYSNLNADYYYWWWVIHLWVEGAWELVTGAIFAFILMKITGVDRQVVEKWLYVEIGLFLFTGVAGTGHHYYWIGAPEFWMALGSIFSALEVIPLSLLMVEAYGQYRVVREGGREFPYKVAFSFLVATAFWNLFGAGVLGFLINLPFVSYFQHGNFLTAAHAHGALMGVYGMLALALGMFSLRNIIKPDRWKERWMMTGFWGLNAGLMGMILMTLLPIGTIQSLQTYERGYWWARSFEFYSQPVINKLLWLRMVPDTVFIVVGILPIVAGLAYGYFHLRRTTAEEAGAQVWIAADAAPEATPEPSMAAGD